MMKDIDVFILCGGEGKRLKAITGKIPKPMVSIGRRVFLDIMIDYLKKLGFRRFILGIGYQAHFIKKYYRRHKIPRIEIIFSQENQPLGTGGAVKKAKRLIRSEIFLVLNGDSFSKFNVANFIKFYKQKKARFLILLKKVRNSQDFGAVTFNRRSEITSFSEKNSTSRDNFINGGVYLFDKSVFQEMPPSRKFSLEHDFFPQMAGKRLYGYVDRGFFIDLGTPERYFVAEKYFLKN